MKLYIFNHNIEPIGIIESFEYLRWTRRYHYCGAFELKAIATKENLSLLSAGNYLWKNDDEDAGIIEYVQITMEENEYITVNGRFSCSLLSRRIIWTTETLKGTLSSCVGQLLNNHIISPSDNKRKMECIKYSNSPIQDYINTQISYRNLLESITSLCELTDTGIKSVFNPSLKTFTVSLYKGSSSEAVFSKEYENIIRQIYTRNTVDYANTALIGGEGEGEERSFAVLGNTAGINRRETFIDAKDLRFEDFPHDYTNALLFRGETKLNELTATNSFDAQINPYGNLKYKTDFDIGQSVKVITKSLGLTLTTRITQIDEVYDNQGHSIDVTFGKGSLSILQKLKGDA